MCVGLVNALTGQAMDAVPTIPRDVMHNNDYPALRAHLDNRFANSIPPEVADARLHQRKQAATETVREFAVALESLARAAYPGDSFRANQAAVTAFHRGLSNQLVALLIRNTPSTDVFAAERHATRLIHPTENPTSTSTEPEYETWVNQQSRPRHRYVRSTQVDSSPDRPQMTTSFTRTAERGNHGRAPPPIRVEKDTAKALKDISSTLEELRRRTVSVVTSAPPPVARTVCPNVCYNCDQPGHFAASCPQPPKKQRNWQTNRKSNRPYQQHRQPLDRKRGHDEDRGDDRQDHHNRRSGN